MVTIKDIAKKAKVSHNTVSVVLGERSKSGRVGEKMRTRIRDIAAKMGYSRNAVATNMAKSHEIQTAHVEIYAGKPGTVNVFSDDVIGMQSTNFTN
jgi:DNA-binding LacI/PurR family transcriptional regulator